MKSKIMLIFFVSLSAVYGQPREDIIRHFSAPSFQKITRYLSQQAAVSNHSFTDKQQNDLVIGDVNPDEVVTITGDYYLDGNIQIVNRGILNIDSANFKIDGDIFIMGEGQMKVTGGTFTVIQEYIYEHDAVVIQSGTLQFLGVQFQSSGQSWSNAFTDSAHYILENCDISDGFITTCFFGNANGIVDNTHLPGEFLCFDQNKLEIKNSDFLLMWLVLPDSSVVESPLPGDSLVTDWIFSMAEPDVEGIPYSVQIDSCTDVMWGLISISGSEATFSDTEFRTVGVMFRKPDSIAVNNITNESMHTDEIVDIPDRMLRLVNSQVHTWSFYPSSNSNVTISNCVFGELLAQDSSKTIITNSVCDGTGGYLGAVNESFLIIVGSLIKSQVISRQDAVLVGVESSFWGSEIDADESSVMFIANTATAVEPEAHSSAVIFEAQCPPVEGKIDDYVPISGTARLLKGPENPIQFSGYSLEYSTDFENPDWQRINGVQSNPVKNDTLIVWDTQDLSAGNYVLQLSLFHSFGDSISMVSTARLTCKTDVLEIDKNIVKTFYLDQNYPNPFNQSTAISYQLPVNANVILKIYDVLGQEIRTLVNENKAAGHHSVVWNGADNSGRQVSSGVYFYRLKLYKNFSQIEAKYKSRFFGTKKLLLLR